MRTTSILRFGLVLCLDTGVGLVCVPANAEDGAKIQSTTQGSGESLPKLILLKPGTRVVKTAPPGWTHLVVKAIPKLDSGDLKSLPAVARSTATLFRTVILADVRPSAGGQPGFELRRIGIGLCFPVEGVDTVVSTPKLDSLKATMTLIQRKALARAEEEMMKGRIKGRTKTFALFSTPVELKVEGEHQPVALRHAFLADPSTGTLRTLIWPMAADPADRKAPDRMVSLPQTLVYDCKLDVAADRMLESIPVYWSFAMSDLPPGEPLKPPPAVQAGTLPDVLPPAAAAAFEAELRRWLADPPRN